MLGFTLNEYMVGTHTFVDDGKNKKTLPLHFNITWGNQSLLKALNPFSKGFLNNKATGLITVGGLVENVNCTGSLNLLYFSERKIRYELYFKNNQGKAYKYVGEKINLWPWNLHKTHVTCYGAITEQESNRIISKSVVFFPYKELLSFIFSFRFQRGPLFKNVRSVTPPAANYFEFDKFTHINQIKKWPVMKKANLLNKDTVNHSQYRQGQQAGLYESYFLRANHPEKPLAFWIRYTIFNPHENPDKALGELWATFFNGETGDHICVKEELPISSCRFETNAFKVAIDKARLDTEGLQGKASTENKHSIMWDLKYTGEALPLFLLPTGLYAGKFPKAKSVVSLPWAEFIGKMVINDEEIPIKDWIGSQNHNWGVKHTDHYAWGQVAGFDNSPASFLEMATARLKFGPIWTPFMTVIVLRHLGREYALNSITQSLKAAGRFNYFDWAFISEDKDIRLAGNITAPREAFIGLQYYNPPGGIKHCLNTKIASCELKITLKKGRSTTEEILTTKSRAAFEILTDDYNHGVKMHV